MRVLRWLVVLLAMSIFCRDLHANPPGNKKNIKRKNFAACETLPQDIFNTIAYKVLAAYTSVPYHINPTYDDHTQEILEKEIKAIFKQEKYTNTQSKNNCHHINLAPTLLYVDGALLRSLAETSKALQKNVQAFLDMQRAKVVTNNNQLEYQLEYEQNVFDYIGYNRYSFLQYAVFYNWADVVAALLDYGIPVNAQNKEGKTSLHVAVKSLSLSALELLVERGADIHMPDKWGQTPLHTACYIRASSSAQVLKRQAIITCLIKNGARKTARDWFGHTPLDIAQARGCSEAERTLLKITSDAKKEALVCL